MEKRKRDRSRDIRYDYRPVKGPDPRKAPCYFEQSNTNLWAKPPVPETKPPAGRQPMMPWEIGWKGYYGEIT